MIWFDLVLWRIDDCKSFPANPFYTYIKYNISRQILKITILNKSDLFIYLLIYLL